MPGPEASRNPVMFMTRDGKLRQARPEASQDQMMLMMRSWWPLHARPRSKPKPSDVHDARRETAASKPRPNDADDALLVAVACPAPKQAETQ